MFFISIAVHVVVYQVSKVALEEMNRLEKIEKEYPIEIEQYLGTQVNIFFFCVTI